MVGAGGWMMERKGGRGDGNGGVEEEGEEGVVGC